MEGSKMILQQSTAYTRMFFMIDSADHRSGKTGLTVAVTLSKNGGTFAAAGGSVTEVASGWYKIALTTTDTNTAGQLTFHCTSAGADNKDFDDQIDSIPITSTIKRGQTVTVPFVMTDSTNHAPATGLTVSAQISKDAAAFVACSNSVSAVSNGVYSVNLTTGETSAGAITLMFSATGADPTYLVLYTQP